MDDETRQIAQTAAVVLEVCAEALLNEPSDKVLSDVRTVADAIGLSCGDWPEPEELRQRYFDRFLVPGGTYYVPANENCMYGYLRDGEYGHGQGPRSDQVLRCYHAVGFDYLLLSGSPEAVDALVPDSLAAECAFLAYLKRQQLQAPDQAQRKTAERLARQFATEHMGLWLEPARILMLRSGADFYTDVAMLAVQGVAACE